MNKSQLLSKYRNTYPDLNNIDDDKLFNALVKKFPEYKNEITDYSSETSKNIFDSLPSFIKLGYNRSIQGMAQEMATGKKRFDLSGYEPGVLADLGAGIASFLAPTDLAVTALGGGIGGAAAKNLATKYVFKNLVRNGVKGSVAKNVARNASANIGRQAGALSLYEGFGGALQQKKDTGEIQLGGVLKDTVSGAVLGGATAGVGTYLTARGASTLTKVAGETAALGTITPLSEGEMPTPQDYLTAGGMLLGLRGVSRALNSKTELEKFIERGRKPLTKREKVSNELAEAYGSEVDTLDLARQQNEIWIDRAGKKWNIINKKGNSYTLIGSGTNEVRNVNKLRFNKTYRLSSENQKATFEDILKVRKQNLRKMEKDLGFNESNLQFLRNNSLNKEKQKLLSDTQVKELIGDRINLDFLNPLELDRYRNSLAKKKLANDNINKIKAEGWVTQEAKSGLNKENFFPKPIQNLFNTLNRAKYRGSQKASIRKFYNSTANYTADKDVLTGEYIGRLMRLGVFNPTSKTINKFRKKGMSKAQAEEAYYRDLTRIKQEGKFPEADSVTDLIARRFSAEGGQLPGYIKNYVPQMLNRDIADAVFDDMLSVIGKKSEIAKILKTDFAYMEGDAVFGAMVNPELFINKNKKLAEYLNKLIQRSSDRLNKNTRDLIFANIESGSDLQYLRAYSRVANGLSEELFNTFGNLEKARRFNVPEELLERNFKTLMTRYATKAANRTAFVKNFGAKGERFDALLKSAEIEDKGIMTELFSHVKGDIEYNSKYNYKPETKNLWRKYMEWQTGFKIGLGYAPLMNVSQATISTALEAGYIPFFRGLFSLTNKNTRELIEKSGVTNYSMFNEMIGISNQSKITNKVVEGLSKFSGFNGINKINQITAAATARVLVDDMFKAVKGQGLLGRSKLRREWAASKLNQLGIDSKVSRLTDDDYVRAMSKFARRSQLQKDILEDPLIFNNPKAKMLTQFKRFGYRQYNYLMDLARHDIAYGNFMPIMRLAIAGVAGAYTANQAKDFMKRWISGEVPPNADGGMPENIQEIAEGVMAVGAFGFMGELVSASLDEGKTVSSSLKFLAYPPLLSDVDNFFTRFLPAIESDFRDLRADALLRSPARLAKLTGSSLLREASKRIETEGMKLDRIKSSKGFRVRKIMNMLEKAQTSEDYDRAYAEVDAWNNANTQFPITMSDISFKKLMQRKMKRYKKQALNEFKGFKL